MEVGTGSTVAYYSPGCAYLRDRLRSLVWPHRGDGWKQAVLPHPAPGNTPVLVLTAKWYDNSFLTAEWGIGMTTNPQNLNDENNPLLASGNYLINFASTGGTPGASLRAYIGKRGTDNPILVKTPTTSGTTIVLAVTAADILAFVNQYGYGRMFIELWDLAYPDPIAVAQVWIGESMRQPS